MVERWFRDLTTKRLKRGSFASVDELIAIEDYIAHHNTDPQPFVWTKSADDPRKVQRNDGPQQVRNSHALH